jgi:putative transposase
MSAEQRRGTRAEQVSCRGSGVFVIDGGPARAYRLGMPRRWRLATGGYVYHVLNRAVARAALFEKDGDYRAFEKLLDEARDKVPMRLLAWCAMPNHWHLVVWPYQDGDLSEYLRWLTVTHVQRWHAHHHTSGTGSLYQGRFKSFPVQEDDHLLRVCRYVERNALRANLVVRAEEWRWSSLWHRRRRRVASLSEWPVPFPDGWLDYVNQPETEAELAALRRSAQRGTPFGDGPWQETTAERLGLQSTLRAGGRPPKRDREQSGTAFLF